MLSLDLGSVESVFVGFLLGVPEGGGGGWAWAWGCGDGAGGVCTPKSVRSPPGPRDGDPDGGAHARGGRLRSHGGTGSGRARAEQALGSARPPGRAPRAASFLVTTGTEPRTVGVGGSGTAAWVSPPDAAREGIRPPGTFALDVIDAHVTLGSA